MSDVDLADQKIAIVGRAGRFPAARSVSEFWSMLVEGRSSGQPLSDAELLAAGVSRKTLADPNYVRVANILPDMECFDAGFFGFSPREASILDPQHRHFLEVGWEALEDAGHMPEDFEGRIGVFAGSGMQAYLPYNLLTNPDLVSQVGMFLLRHTGNDKDFLPTRLSYILNLTGPSVAVQTACSTGLVSVHTAIGSLLNMECDMAIAGGVTIELPHHVGYAYAEGEILSPDGLCRAFDEDSKGTVFGSGAALVVLRRYEDAIADGDDIKAVILASAVNNDGAGKASYLAPSEDGQAEAGAEALALSGLAADEISYIETHGTGTPIGDPIELAALRQVYGDAPKDSIKVGSVKTNIGHLDTAAGSASLIKVVEAMRHRHLPATLNFRTPNSRFDFATSPFSVAATGQEWLSDGPRRAAVNSLGVGGTNAHVIVEEAPERVAPVEDGAWRIFPFSARTPAALERTKAKWVGFLEGADVPATADMAFTLRHGRRAFDDRFAIAARSAAELKAALADPETPLIRQGKTGAGKPRVVFLFPGGGAQYPGAGAEMIKGSPVFAAAVEECFAALPDTAPPDLRKMMFDHALCEVDAAEKLARSTYAIPALFILEYAYMRVWRDWGVTPDAILAHSVGEYAGAVTAGALSLQDALKIVTLRGRVMDDAPSGAMTSVPMGEAQARALIGDDLDIAAVNTLDSSVISGPVAEIQALEDRLMGTPHEARRIKIDVAAHSRMLDGQTEPFRAAFEGVRFGEVSVPMISSMRGGWPDAGDLVTADYWVNHMRNTVRFADAAAAALADPDTIVIEVGPGQTLSPLIKAAEAAHAPRAVLASAPRPLDPVDEMGFALASLGGLWANGYDLPDTAWPGDKGQRVSLPTYAFEKERHWVEPGHISAAAGVDAAEDEAIALSRIPEIDDWVEVLGWEERARSGGRPGLDGRWLVFAERDLASAHVIAKLKAAQARVDVVYADDGFSKREEGYRIRPGVEEDYAALYDDLGRMPDRILSLWGLGDHGAEALFDASYVLARTLVDANVQAGCKVTLVSQDASDAGGAKIQDAGAAAMLGAVRVMPRELQGVRACLVDVPADPSEVVLSALLEEAAGKDPDDYVALRQGRRFIRTRRETPAPMPDVVPNRLRSDGVYVVTGGMGGIGRALAVWLAATVKARIALVSRNATEDADLRAEIEAAGGQVMICAADVTDTEAMRRVLTEVTGRFGDIHGVIHAAGVLKDGLLGLQSLDEARPVLAPKLIGAQVLDRLLPDGTLDFFAMVSSSSVAIGPPGQTAYVAANAALEAIASARSDGMSLAWGAWSDIGMAAKAYAAGADAPGGDPLLGRRGDLPGGAIRFDTVIDPNTDWRVREHVVGGHPVLPGTAYVELAYAAAKAAFGTVGAVMESVSFELPMVFDHLARKVTIELQPTARGYDLAVESVAIEGQQPTRHMVAELIRDTKGAGKRDGAADRLSTTTSHTTHALQEGAVDFGPRWDSVDEIRAGHDLATGTFTLPGDFTQDLKDHPLHPAMVDMAATVGLAAAERVANAVYVPMAVGRVRAFGPVPAKLTSRASLSPDSLPEMVSFDVTLFDERGAPVLELEDVAMRAVDRGALATGLTDKSLTETLLSTGIRAAEAPQVFARAFAHTGRNLVISPVSLDLLRLAMTEKPRTQAAVTVEAGAEGSELPSTETERRLAQIWTDVLGVADIRKDSSFFGLGGHSLLAVRLFNQIHKEFDLNLPISTLFQSRTLVELAALIEAETLDESFGDANDDAEAPWDTSVLIEKGPTEQSGIPLFIVGGMGGNLNNLIELAGALSQHRAIIGFQTRGVLGHKPHSSIEDMAAENITYMRNHQPRGPYLLAGYSGGSLTALEMARQLEAEGEQVKHLIVLDHFAPGFARDFETEMNLTLRERLREEFSLLRVSGFSSILNRLRPKMRSYLKRLPIFGRSVGVGSMPLERFEHMKNIWLKAAGSYQGGRVEAEVTVFRVRPQRIVDNMATGKDDTLGWSQIVAPGRLDMQWVPGDHTNMVKGEHAVPLAQLMETALK